LSEIVIRVPVTTGAGNNHRMKWPKSSYIYAVTQTIAENWNYSKQ
jgi:hypothetical protein